MTFTKQSSESFLQSLLWSAGATDLFELLPCAIAIWQPDGVLCFLNARATHLTGFSDDELNGNPSLWVNRIDPADREPYSAAWEKLRAGERIVNCDYRFSPKDSGKKIWLRDVSVSHQDSRGEVQCIISCCADITDLKVENSKSYRPKKKGALTLAIGELVHEIQNDIQTISMELDLMQLEGDISPAYQPLVKRMDRFNELIQELRENTSPAREQWTQGNPGAVLEDVVHHMEDELRGQGICFRLVRRTPIPLVKLDLRQFRRAIETIIEFSRSLLPQGGELRAEVGLTNSDGQNYIEITLATSSVYSIPLNGKEGLQPLLQVNDQQAGVDLSLAYQILRRHQGKVLFRRENPRRGQVTILLKVR